MRITLEGQLQPRPDGKYDLVTTITELDSKCQWTSLPHTLAARSEEAATEEAAQKLYNLRRHMGLL